MQKKSPLILVATLVSLLLFSGCIAAIGNDTPPPSTASLGQQLIDLQKARDAGAMTESEYQTQRARFLKDR